MRRPNKNIILVIGRDNFSKDYDLMKSLLKLLKETDHRVISYKSKKELEKEETRGILNANKKILSLPMFIRIPLKAFMLLKYPNRWVFYLNFRSIEKIENRIKELEIFIEKLGKDKNVIILSRSSGGIISSIVADHLNIKKLICLGYPFRHPEKKMEIGRFKHLESLRTPFLIIQGIHDEYGGKDIKNNYTLSTSITLNFVNADHDFKLSKVEWNNMATRIVKFILE